jgi:hypothetical protein
MAVMRPKLERICAHLIVRPLAARKARFPNRTLTFPP